MKKILIKCNILFSALLIMFLSAVLLGVNTNETAYAAAESESESNNTAATASTINVNTTISGNLSSNSDVDWYKFNIDIDGYFYVSFNHTIVDDSDSLWLINFYDSTAVNRIDGNNSYFGVTGKANKVTNTFGVPAGTYYIKITRGNYSSDYSGVEYQLMVHYEVTNNWETENNNDSNSADVLTVNETKFGSLSTNGDVDWYKFNIDIDGYFYVSFNHTIVDDSDSLWLINFYDSTAVNRIDGNNSYFGVIGKANKVTNTFGVPAGTYYIKITRGNYSSDYSGVEYQLTVHYEVANNWETENNNDSNSADVLTVNEMKFGSLSTNGDVDWYKFNLNASSEIQLTFNHEIVNDSDTLWYIYLYDSTAVNQLMKYGRKGTTASASTDYISVRAGTYYIKITRGNYSSDYSGVSYSLIVTERHDHIGQWLEKVAPTCTTAGTEERVCTICGNIEIREIIALGHDYDAGVHTKEATIVHTGEITHTCSRCGDFYIEKDKSKVWILPVIIVGSIIVLFGVINYIRMMKKKS